MHFGRLTTQLVVGTACASIMLGKSLQLERGTCFPASHGVSCACLAQTGSWFLCRLRRVEQQNTTLQAEAAREQ